MHHVEYKLNPPTCPSCGTKMQAAACVSDDDDTFVPQEGNPCLCAACVTPLVVTVTGDLREMTEDDFKKLPTGIQLNSLATAQKLNAMHTQGEEKTFKQ